MAKKQVGIFVLMYSFCKLKRYIVFLQYYPNMAFFSAGRSIQSSRVPGLFFGVNAMGRRRTKAERQAWWNGLSPQEQQEYIERKQARKTAWREKHPKEEPAYNPKYPWATNGIDDSNRAAWQKVILKKNPWLNLGVFNKGQTPRTGKSGQSGDNCGQ